MRNWKSRLLLLSALASLGLPAEKTTAAPGGAREVRILFTNNSNGKLTDCNCRNDPLGGLAERVALVREYRAKYPDVLLLDSGGYLGLNDVERKGPVALKLMDAMGYAAMGIGDQELYRGLNRFLALFGGWSNRIINASLTSVKGERVFTEYRVFTVNGVRVAVTGLVGPETFSFFPKERADFGYEAPEKVLARLLPVLRKSADYVIVLSQLGNKADEALFAGVEGVDLVIGGHSQTLLEEQITVGKCRIVQAGKGGGHVGEVILKFNTTGKPGGIAYRLLEVNDTYRIPRDIQGILDAAEK